MEKQKIYDVFLVLGAVWFIVGFLIYQNSAVWPLGFIFLIIGLIGKFVTKIASTKEERCNLINNGWVFRKRRE